MKMVKCPAEDCSVEADEHDLVAQSQHMTACHPEIVDQRRREAGFRQAADGSWIDTLVSPSPR